MNAASARVLCWCLVLGLSGLGMVMIASTTVVTDDGGTLDYGHCYRQGFALLVGLLGAVALTAFGADFLRRTWLNVAIAIAVMAMLAALPLVSRPVNGAWRWFDLGPLKVQPAELAKIALVVVTAAYLVRVQEKVRVHWHGALVPILGFLVLAGLVLGTRDLGTVLVLGVVLWAMLFFARARWMFTTILGLACVPLAAYITVFQEGYRLDRVLAFSDPWAANGPAGYHLQQSSLAIGSGGVWGTGLGQGTDFVPERHTDFIYAVICQELGMVGGLIVALAYLLLIACGLAIANASREQHHRLLAIGAIATIGFQAFWNMLVVTGAVPTKGLTLPFVSYGGSSLVVSLAAIGILDAVARRCPAPRPDLRHTSGRLGAVILKNGRATGVG